MPSNLVSLLDSLVLGTIARRMFQHLVKEHTVARAATATEASTEYPDDIIYGV